jgi:apolipoprotein N-acyltransferase
LQHKQYAVLRAIENRKWIARCAQTGISCYIDPLGNIYDEIPYGTEGIISRNIIANNEKTFYAVHGDIIGMISYYVGILSLLSCIILYVRKKLSKKTFKTI